jgi:Leucine-rich repeat (LRR) protein
MGPHDFKKILELCVTSQGIDLLNSGNDVLTQLGNHLRKLDLSYNKIPTIQNLQMMKQLVELNLSFNPIDSLQDLALPQLQILRLDGCRISRIENQFRICKKLEILSLNHN